jgi:hypothetical protein
MVSDDYEISFTKRISKMGKNFVIKIPLDRHDDFEHKDLVKVILLKKDHKSTHLG